MYQTEPTRPDLSLRVGTRGSALALAQTISVIGLLQQSRPECSFVQQIIKSEGDTDKTSPLTQIGGRGVFTSILQERLLHGEIDLAVHSAKDVPSLSPVGLELAAFPNREDPRDALITRHGVALAELPGKPVIGTSSRRRAAQILALRPDTVIRELRGNIDTRLRKARGNDYDAIILAVAGIRRMGWANTITEYLPFETFTPAPAQGAIAVETRIAPDSAAGIVRAIDDPAVSLAVRIERAFLRGVGGGCTTPIGAHAVIAGKYVTFHAMLSDDDGSRLVRERISLDTNTAEEEVFALAGRMLRETRPVWSTSQRRKLLAGKTVIVTGSTSQSVPVQGLLESLGATVKHLGTIQILPPAQPIDPATLGQFDWAVVTSPNAFPYAAAALRFLLSQGAKLAVVGCRTAEAATAFDLTSSLIGDNGAESLVALLRDRGIAGARVVCFLSGIARPNLTAGLQKAGAEVTVVTAYRNVAATDLPDDIEEIITRGSISAITFASPSAVRRFIGLAGGRIAAMSGAAFVAIGETTAEALGIDGLPVHAIAATPSPEGMVEAVCGAVGLDARGTS